VENLELAYGEVPAVRAVSFEVAEGEIVTLIGANGAGKSTTMRGVAGAMLPRRGRIVFEGRDVTRMPAHQRAAAVAGVVDEDPVFGPHLVGAEARQLCAQVVECRQLLGNVGLVRRARAGRG